MKISIRENKDADQLRGTRIADQRLLFFATQIAQFVYFRNPNFQAFKYLLWLKSPICVGLALSDNSKTGLILMLVHDSMRQSPWL